MPDRLNPGDSLAVRGSITSQDGRFTLVLQGDGNLVLYWSGGAARWATHTDGRAVSRAIMQADGNFVLYAPDGTAPWASGEMELRMRNAIFSLRITAQQHRFRLILRNSVMRSSSLGR